MHEYYHPDTGEGVHNLSFQSWNLLVNNMIAWLEGRERVVEF
jgi:putative isomerase